MNLTFLTDTKTDHYIRSDDNNSFGLRSYRYGREEPIDRFKREDFVHHQMELLKVLHKDLSPHDEAVLERDLGAEYDAHTKALETIVGLYQRVTDLRQISAVSEENLAACFAWGPSAERIYDNQSRYSMRFAIDEAGGLEPYVRKKFVAVLREHLSEAITRADNYDYFMKQVLMIAMGEQPDMDQTLLEWLIHQAAQTEVAVIDKAKVNFSHHGYFYLSGDQYKHPRLGEDDGIRGMSDRDRQGMTTTPLVGYWPDLRLARTVSRFYLLPNGAEEPSNHMAVFNRIDFDQLLTRLREVELSDTPEDDEQESERREEMNNQIITAVNKALDPDAPVSV